MALIEEKHVMLSYNHKSKNIVRNINNILKAADIRTWMDEDGGMGKDIYESMAVGVEKASIVCCFMTPAYQESVNCKLELEYAQKRGKEIIPCILTEKSETFPASWLGIITGGLNYINIRDISEDNIRKKAKELIDRIKQQFPPSASKSNDEPTYLFELIKYKYLLSNRIERIVNSSKSFPIEDSYINLAIVETKEQQEKEKKLRNTRNSDIIINTFEEIYGTKTGVNVKDIFEKCNDRTKRALVLGRAGIGKSTFCQYAVYQWANNAIWPEYDLVIFMPLRSLTADRYPPGVSYTPIDLIKKQYFFNQALSETEEKILKTPFNKSKVLWLLDGYDEIAGNIPTHLEDLMEQLLNTRHHILTSRPYAIILSYDVKMEIIGFTDDNITNYIKKFFNSVKDELENASDQIQNLLTFLKWNPNIWGVAHIPVNLELICTLWCDTDWLETITLTMTALYDKMTEWLCKRYLMKRDTKNKKLVKDDVYTDCKKELTFLETLAFQAMRNKSIILKPDLMKKVEQQSNWSLRDHPDLLNIGILKSLNDKVTGNDNDREKNHYFVHLSFQEYYAARFLVTALQGNTPQDAIQFIKDHKYNQRFSLMLTFASGLLNETGNVTCMDTFWDTILGEPLDLVGIRHIQIVISCLEETGNNKSFRQYPNLMNIIIRCIQSAVVMQNKVLHACVQHALKRSPSIVNDEKIIDVFTTLLQTNNPSTKQTVMKMICELPVLSLQPRLLSLCLTILHDVNGYVVYELGIALGKMCGKAATNDMIKTLVTAVADPNSSVRWGVCLTLREMGEKAATNDVVKALLTAIVDPDSSSVRDSAAEALGQMGEKTVTNDVIKVLVTALADPEYSVRQSACIALGKMGQKAATSDVIKALVTALADPHRHVRWNACISLSWMGEKVSTYDAIKVMLTEIVNTNDSDEQHLPKVFGKMVEKMPTNDLIKALLAALTDSDGNVRSGAYEAVSWVHKERATNDVIKALIIAFTDPNPIVRTQVCVVLGMMGKKAATNDVIRGLLTALEDPEHSVRSNACEALGKMSQKAATNDVIKALLTALADCNNNVRRCAFIAIGEMGENAATIGVITALITALTDSEYWVRQYASAAIGKMGEKATTNDVIKALITALTDSEHWVRESAAKALGEMGEKVATNDVIKALVAALVDPEKWVRESAAKALGEMGEKAATNDVIKALVTALVDSDSINVRESAAKALGEMGEKAATGDGIRALLAALGDPEYGIRNNASKSLRKMGERAATNDVIKALITALADPSSNVREGVCEVLGNMGVKAVIDDVIRALLTALTDSDTSVKKQVCRALGMMGEKAATSDVIKALLTALEDSEHSVRSNACEALGKMGETAATTDVINGILGMKWMDWNKKYILKKMLKLLLSRSLLDSITLLNLLEFCRKDDMGIFGDVSTDNLIKAYLDTGVTEWCTIIPLHCISAGIAITALETTVQVYGNDEPKSLEMPDRMLRDNFVHGFVQEISRLHVLGASAAEDEGESIVTSAVCNVM